MDGVEYTALAHDDVIKWKHFPCCWPFVRGIHQSPVQFPHNIPWRGALMFSLIYAWTNGWVSNRDTGGFSHLAHYDATVMIFLSLPGLNFYNSYISAPTYVPTWNVITETSKLAVCTVMVTHARYNHHRWSRLSQSHHPPSAKRLIAVASKFFLGRHG